MKRRDLEKKLKNAGWYLLAHGGNPGSIPGRITRPKPDFLNESQVFLFVEISMKVSVFNGSGVRLTDRNKKKKPAEQAYVSAVKKWIYAPK